MSRVEKSVLVPFSAEAMFDLVDAVEQYPEFLPWCGSTSVLQRDAFTTLATIEIRYHGITRSFTTENSKIRPTSMHLQLVEGPFNVLSGVWQFSPLTTDACKIEFTLDYGFGNALLESALGPVMSMIAETFVDRFVARAENLNLGKQCAPSE